MPTLLHIDSSSRDEASVSRHLTREFAQNWKRANPGGRVDRDTFLQPHLESIKAYFLSV